MDVASGERLQDPYEQIPYPGFAEPRSHLRVLEALATMFGLQPADIEHCRVLELGCASGRNLLPQAEQLPHSRFVGLDTSARQIADARADATAVSLDNVELRRANIMDVDASWGQFDYVLCPGVFSWVDATVRSRMLGICRENLTPQGVALVTYNAKPGWLFQGAVRDLLRYHVAPIPDARQQIAEARAILEFVAEQCPGETVQGRVLRAERDYLRTVRDDYVYHDYLVACNEPVYFHEFVTLAEQHGLQFLCDADMARMSGTFMSGPVQAMLAKTPLIQRCQLLDFLRNELFHRTLLCHRDIAVARQTAPEVMPRFHLKLIALPQPAEFTVADTQPVTFVFRHGKLTSSAPLGKAVLAQLMAAWPATISFAALAQGAESRLAQEARGAGPNRQADPVALAQAVASLFHAGLLVAYVHPPQFCRIVPERPRASAFCRRLASRGTYVTNLLHENVVLDDLHGLVLSQLDGELDRSALVASVQAAVDAGRLSLAPGAGSLETQLERALANLCERALLVAE
jgi:SAM-dependent methyltransferase